MKPDLCNQKVKDLTVTLEALETERRELAARRIRLTIPPVDKEMLEGILSEFDETMVNGTNQPAKKTPSPPGGEEGAYPRSPHDRGLVLFTEQGLGSYGGLFDSPSCHTTKTTLRDGKSPNAPPY